MTWEISHSADAWDCFGRGIEAQSDDWLREAIATCFADAAEDREKEFTDACWTLEIDDSNTDALPTWGWYYERYLATVKHWPRESLEFAAMDWAERNSSCSNGGFDFYVDRGGFYSINLDEYTSE